MIAVVNCENRVDFVAVRGILSEGTLALRKSSETLLVFLGIDLIFVIEVATVAALPNTVVAAILVIWL